MKDRFELIGSGIGDSFATVERLKELVKKHGGKNIRAAYNFSWRNQPRTVRFDADDFEIGEEIGEKVRMEIYADYMKQHNTTLTPMIRAYPMSWHKVKD